MIHRFVATVGDTNHEVTIEATDDHTFRVSVDGRVRVVEARRVEAGLWSLLPPSGGAARLVDVDGRSPDYRVSAGGVTLPIKLQEGRRAIAARLGARVDTDGPRPVRSPMPGKIVKVLVKAGDRVKAHQGVVVVEAMKMENELKAPRDGSVTEVAVHEGQAVEAGQALVVIA